ncbi:hypothetical protein EUX98_g8824 [Antrodiella citrinella]|uniref:CCHC-type domain-containing protein n=1 Tax=Antrodiella citrinella TaxID=2447956 RepID=A0A4S4M257_9APHY|nr:hypothetical protein EUX98_g8824 [Antrodiella citrinella]
MASTTTRTRASRKKAADAAAAAQDPGGAPNNPQLPADMGPPNQPNQPNQPNLTEAGDNYPVPAQTTNENERMTGRDDEGGPTAQRNDEPGALDEGVDPHLHPVSTITHPPESSYRSALQPHATNRIAPSSDRVASNEINRRLSEIPPHLRTAEDAALIRIAALEDLLQQRLQQVEDRLHRTIIHTSAVLAGENPDEIRVKLESPSPSTVWRNARRTEEPTPEPERENSVRADVEEMYGDYPEPEASQPPTRLSTDPTPGPRPSNATYGPSAEERLRRANLGGRPFSHAVRGIGGRGRQRSSPGRYVNHTGADSHGSERDYQDAPAGGSGPPGPPDDGDGDDDADDDGDDDGDDERPNERDDDDERRPNVYRRAPRGRATRSTERERPTSYRGSAPPNVFYARAPSNIQVRRTTLSDTAKKDTDFIIELLQPLNRAPIEDKNLLAMIKQLKPATPDSYNGEDDAERFETWIASVVRWLELNNVVGEAVDWYRVKLLGQLLKKDASEWYLQVIQPREQDWTFRDALCALFTRFIHRSSVQIAEEKFNTVKYTKSGGVADLANRILTYAKKLPEMPPQYFLKSKLLRELPHKLRHPLGTSRGITAQNSKFEEIVAAAQEIEDYLRQEEMENTSELTRVGSVKTSGGGINSSTAGPSTSTQSVPRAADGRFASSGQQSGWKGKEIQRGYTNNRDTYRPTRGPYPGYRPRVMFDANRRAIQSPESAERLERKTSTSAMPKVDKSRVKCYACEQMGHYATDPECPKYGKRPTTKPALRRMAEVLEEDDERQDEAEKPELMDGEKPHNEEPETEFENQDETRPLEGDQYEPDEKNQIQS